MSDEHTYSNVDSGDDGEPLVSAFVVALHALAPIAAECLTGVSELHATRTSRLRDAVTAIEETRERVEMRIYFLCNALAEERETRRAERARADQAEDERDEARERVGELDRLLSDEREAAKLSELDLREQIDALRARAQRAEDRLDVDAV
jgi:chromosome segregation ATPase